MQTIRIYGASDDLVEVERGTWAEEYGERDILNIGGRMLVVPTYAANGCWCFAPAQIDEDIPLPDWPIRVSSYKSGYSTLLEIDAPDDAVVSVLPKSKRN